MKELSAVVQKIENAEGSFPDALLEEFAQKIDRIMGAAQTLEMLAPGNLCLERVGKIAEVCKSIGYKAAKKKEIKVLPYCSAFWADTIELMEALLQNVEDPDKSAEISKKFSKILQGRLEWLNNHLK